MSNSLTLYLALLGGLVLAIFVAHGAWTSSTATARSHKRAGLEPLGPGSIDRSDADTIPTEFGDTIPGELMADKIEASPMALPTAKRVHHRLDALIDTIATLTLEQPMSGDHVLMHLPSSRRAGSKPFMIEGLPVDGDEWEAPQAGVIYRELQAGVLLANRMGGLNEIEYSEFVHKIQACADAMGAVVEFPDMLDVVARAKELDAFASGHDAQLALRLHARGSAWSIGYVQQQAARHGFMPGAFPGRFVLPSTEEGAPPILSLQFDAQAAFAEEPENATLREIMLAFDVPQTSPDLSPYNAWCAAGEALSLGLDALMADDQGQPFSPAAFAAIAGELERLYQALAARDLAAGSAAARRLFS